MHIHASCAAREGAAVLLLGPPGSGKSDLLLRLLSCGFALVADDRVIIENGIARAPVGLAGLLEVRGLGIVRMDHSPPTPVNLVIRLEPPAERMPEPALDPDLRVPVVSIDPRQASAVDRVALALDCVLGRRAQLAGAFAG